VESHGKFLGKSLGTVDLTKGDGYAALKQEQLKKGMDGEVRSLLYSRRLYRTLCTFTAVALSVGFLEEHPICCSNH